jgi:translocation and assembly module TamB
MRRRRLVALVSVGVLLALGLLAVGTVFFFTGTTNGRERLRGIAQPFIASKIHGGTIYIGHLSGSFLTSLTIDSLAIRDKRGELLVSTGRATFNYDPRDLIDNRVYIRRAFIEHPYVHLIQHANYAWNFREIFASTSTAPEKPKDATARGIGDYIVIDSATTRNAAFLITMPWTPDTAFRGAARDSVIRVHLTDPEKAVVPMFDGFGRRYKWTNVHGLITHARLADPDSDRKFGMEFHVDTLSADEFVPTFKFRKVTADARKLGDSVWFKVAHFDMPASTGTGGGKVWWGSDLPMRYDIAIQGDSVSLDDVNWVYPTLPKTGGGALTLLIKNDPKNLEVVDFKLSKMDVRSTKSHLTGDMSFGVGAPLLLVRNVNLRADPVDFDLIRTLNGKPFPMDWQGQLFGSVTARGGPLTHFVVDDARGVFRDAHVPGAESRFSARGELDILYPALTAFHNFFVDVGSLDLRTVEFLNPNFPRLGGTVSGTATLDSSWLDVRFSNADLTHRDGPAEPSHVTGRGRVTYGDQYMSYDLALEAQPLSLTTLARSYPALSVRGTFSGPLRVTGSSPDLEISTSLQGQNGALSFEGHVDADTIGGIGVHGRGQFSGLSLTRLLEKPTIPANTLNGHYDLAIDSIGPNWATLYGSASLALDRSMFDGLRVNPSHARVHFADGQMKVDSFQVRSPAFTAVATGGIGLPNGRPDSLLFTMNVDSLGGLRLLAHADSALADSVAIVPDSIDGRLTAANMVALGTMDALTVRGSAEASGIYFNNSSVKLATLDFDLQGLPKSLAGGVTLRADSATVAGVALDSIRGRLGFTDLTHARFELSARSRNGPAASATGNWTSTNGANEVLLAALRFDIDSSQWSLAGPARLALDSTSIRVDSLLLRNRDSASVALSWYVPSSGAAAGMLSASHMPLRDLATLAQLRDPVSGFADLNLVVSGTRTAPQLSGKAALSSIKWGGIDIDRATSDARLSASRLIANADVMVKGQTAITAFASLPVNVALFSDLTLFNAQWGKDTLTAFVRADSADLSILQPLLGGNAVIDSVKGRLRANVSASGTPQKKRFEGSIDVANGSARLVASGVNVMNVNGRIVGQTNAAGQVDVDTVRIDASTPGKPNGTLAVRGSVKDLTTQVPNFNLALGVNQFHALNRRSLADVYLTTTDTVRLRGPITAPVLTGALRVDRTSIFLQDADIARKRSVLFSTDEDTVRTGSRLGGSAMVSMLMTKLTPIVTVSLGNDVRLRSAEANVRLAGELRVGTSTNQSTTTSAATGQLVPRLTLEGALRTEGGTYNLNLGLAQREFQVLSGGTVTFTLADRPENPTLDIKARHDIKQQGTDLGVIVNLKGPLLSPGIDFSATGVDYEIPPSDLISYLIIGKPGFDFTQPGSQVLASFLAPTVSAVTADILRRNLGSRLDVFQFQFGGGGGQDQTGLSRNGLTDYLKGSTLGAEQRFGQNLYLGVSTGFCNFDQNRVFNNLNNFGAKAEWRFDPKLSMQLGYDPASATRSCSGGQNVIGLVSPPPNFSFSLSHVWRF